MKLAHVVWGMKTGGVETMLVNVINEQIKTEIVCLFIINEFIDDFIIEKLSPLCKIYKLNRKPGDKNPFDILKLNYWIWRYGPDIIHVHSHRVSKLIFGNWNIVRTIHGMNNIPEEYSRMKALYSISEVVKDFTQGQGFRSTVILNGIKTSEMRVNKKLGATQGIYKIIQVSRLYVQDKGQDVVLKALKKIVTEGQRNFEMHFIGTGPSEKMLKEMTEKLNISDYVIFEGIKSQEYIYQHLSEYNCFVQPSRCEGFGLTVAEAMAAKIPVLVSDIQGPMEVIEYGKYGMSFKSENVDDLAEKLKIVLRGEYDYSLVEKAYKRVCNEYDVSKTAKMYISEYRKILQK